MLVSLADQPVDADSHYDDQDTHENDVYQVHLVRGHCGTHMFTTRASVQFLARARVRVKSLTSGTQCHMVTLTLARVTVPRVTCTVDTLQLVTCQTG